MKCKRWLVLPEMLALLMILVACGGGGAGAADEGSSNWDEMIWDRDSWE